MNSVMPLLPELVLAAKDKIKNGDKLWKLYRMLNLRNHWRTITCVIFVSWTKLIYFEIKTQKWWSLQNSHSLHVKNLWRWLRFRNTDEIKSLQLFVLNVANSNEDYKFWCTKTIAKLFQKQNGSTQIKWNQGKINFLIFIFWIECTESKIWLRSMNTIFWLPLLDQTLYSRTINLVQKHIVTILKW